MGFLDQAREQKSKLNSTDKISRIKDSSTSSTKRIKDSKITQNNTIKKEIIGSNSTQEIRRKIEQQKNPEDSIKDRTQTIANIDENSDQDKIFEADVYTVFDSIINYLIPINKAVSIKTIARDLKLKLNHIEEYLEILEKEKAIKLKYPINFMADIKVKIDKLPKMKNEIKLPVQKELVESYTLTADNVTAEVKIWNAAGEEVKIYEISNPELGLGTKIFTSYIINELSKTISIDTKDIRDEKKHKQIKKKFIKQTKELIKTKIKNLDEKTLTIIAGIILHKIYGLGEMELIMADNWLEEIAINGSKFPISVYHKRFGWVKTTKLLKNDQEIYNFASQIGRKVGRQINSLNPLMDAHLITGDRVAATLFPISTAGHTITIRRFSRNPWTIIHMIDPKVNTMSPEIAAFLWLCIQYELNILVAGGTASGKTSVLNSVAALIPNTQRILSIEDTRELTLPNDLQWNWIPLSSRKPNPEGHGGVSMLDLMVESLRMRPDRIIVGEVRRREQAETLFETMHTGHSVYATIHADTVEQVERRLLEPPIEIPKTEIGALQLIIVQYRDRRKGSRRTLEVAEILSQETDDKSLSLNYLFRWKPREDKFEKINNSIRVMEDLNLHTGLTETEIKNDLKLKEQILLWLLKHNLKDVDLLGNVIKLYYKSPQKVIEAMKKDLDPKEIIQIDIMK